MITLCFSARSRFPLLVLCLTISAYLSMLSPAYPENTTPEKIGLQIARDADLRDKGFSNFTAQQTMLLRNKHGQESLRQLRIKILEVPEEGNKSLFVFDNPRDIQGTALLTHAHKEGPDDQWLYLPALERVKRISSSNQSGSFMGSEFSYEDITNQEVEKFTYRYLYDESCGDLTCTVTERFPVDKESGYRRQMVWRDRDELRTWKVQYYDRRDEHLKTLILDNYEQYLKQYWRAGLMTMTNHLTGKSTVMTWTNFQFKTDLNDRNFTKTGLKRAR